MARAEPSDEFPPFTYWDGSAMPPEPTPAELDAEVARLGLTVGPWRQKPWNDGTTGYRWRFCVYLGEDVLGYGYARGLVKV